MTDTGCQREDDVHRTSGVRRRAAWAARLAAVAGPCALAGAGLVGCAGASSGPTTGVIRAIGAENEYADVLGQIGGRYVRVSSILSNPNTDPHAFESSPSVAQEVSAAELVVQNGVGYDDFMGKIESASPSSNRKVIVVQRLLGLPDSTPNPHLWYDPATMPKVARAMADDLAMLRPAHAAYFQSRLQAFDRSLSPWLDAIATFKARFAGTAVATTEPVADYLLQAMGLDNLTPFSFQADIMNGTDPPPQDISLENGFFTGHKIKVFCYNEQVVSSLTASIRQSAEKSDVPVVAVYETMPTPGYDYQTWMLAEVQDIQRAIATGVSTEHL